jgi:hypothetical protein
MLNRCPTPSEAIPVLDQTLGGLGKGLLNLTSADNSEPSGLVERLEDCGCFYGELLSDHGKVSSRFGARVWVAKPLNCASRGTG